MFSSPTKTKVSNEDGYSVHLTHPVLLDVPIHYAKGSFSMDMTCQSKFDALRQRMLSELVKNTQLFKNSPSYTSLDTISPPWGFVSTSNGTMLSPYTVVRIEFPNSFTSGSVSFTLTDIMISRSSIVPQFCVSEVKNVIELDWGTAADDELAEVSDIPSVEGGSELKLVDPAAREREKQSEKTRIRHLFQQAEHEAECWYEKYEPSDDESTFSEWIAEEDETHTLS